MTNRFPSERFLDRESRGQLVLEALRASTAMALHQQLQSLTAKRFNTFHLLYADAGAAFVTWSDGERIRHDVLKPGLHVVTERSLGGDDFGRSKSIVDAWPKLERVNGEPTPKALQQLLASRNAQNPAGSVCVDLPEMDYGTRSSLVLYMREKMAGSRWFWAEGRPDQVPFVEHPELIASLS